MEGLAADAIETFEPRTELGLCAGMAGTVAD